MPALLSRSTTPFFILMLVLSSLISGCATQHSSKLPPIWQSREQFVSLAPRDDQGVARVPNRHPVSLSTGELREALASLTVQLPDTPKPVAVFGDSELDVLSEQLHVGLQQAGTDQDLVFAILGEMPLLKSFASVDVVTTGRVFYRENGLNLIFGMVRELVKERDRRLQPFLPGSRLHESALPGPVSATADSLVHPANRPDWVVLPLGSEGKVQKPTPPAAKPDAAAPESGKAVRPAEPKNDNVSNGHWKGIEERLRFLGELKAKGLITDEEYRAKKESILKEL
jgi:hypothetical protein